jgi:endonuclease YncB( thermonuclease family)
MELASRIVSVLLGMAVMVLVLWPVTLPVGFGEVWWASRQAQSRSETPPPAEPAPPQPASKPAPLPQAEAPPPTPAPAAPTPPAPAPHAVLPNAAAPEQAQPTGEKAEAERLAAVQEKEQTGAVAPQAATKLYYRVTVRDGGTLVSGGVVIKLSGIAVRGADATCKGAGGKAWSCGAAAKAALTRLIRSRAVTCELPKGGDQKEFAARCSVAGADLSTWMVRQGWAEPKNSQEPALAAAEEAAKSERVGLWRGAE